MTLKVEKCRKKQEFGVKLTKNGQNRHENFFSADVTFLDSLEASLMQKAKKSYGGKYENFALQTDGQRTDGAGFIGPVSGSKNF